MPKGMQHSEEETMANLLRYMVHFPLHVIHRDALSSHCSESYGEVRRDRGENQ